ncbi:MAG TPA: ABC transporter permease [bacterium]|nr:ABC transporter permease [bacterium]
MAVLLARREQIQNAAVRLRQRQHIHDLLVRVAAAVAILGLWEALGRRINPLLFAPPSAIVRASVQVIGSGELWKYLSVSLRVFAIGTLLGTVAGIAVGIVMARVRILDLSLEPFMIALYSTPMVALIPLLVLWLGFGDGAKSAVIFLFTVFPVLVNTYQGVKSVDPKLLEVARSYRSPERTLWVDVILPSSVPFIVAGIRLAIGRGLVGMVVADLYTAVSGIGYLIVRYAQNIQIDRLFVPVVVLSLLGITLVQGLRWLEMRVAPWLHVRDD